MKLDVRPVGLRGTAFRVTYLSEETGKREAEWLTSLGLKHTKGPNGWRMVTCREGESGEYRYVDSTAQVYADGSYSALCIGTHARIKEIIRPDEEADE